MSQKSSRILAMATAPCSSLPPKPFRMHSPLPARPRLVEVSQLWIQERAADGEVFDQEIATQLLSDLARLAHGLRGRDHRLYCWTS
ncbi:hypothetical protein FHR33_009930 [Nonomuraea dietziae]|uniref:Uncharacterized protein n=1 Tax=Nonomuraea dietziae TaxID=65515 RepID=A0A7W5VB21_9ACTN|nr:hypothetical protein [Nonomuraea dietziae]